MSPYKKTTSIFRGPCAWERAKPGPDHPHSKGRCRLKITTGTSVRMKLAAYNLQLLQYLARLIYFVGSSRDQSPPLFYAIHAFRKGLVWPYLGFPSGRLIDKDVARQWVANASSLNLVDRGSKLSTKFGEKARAPKIIDRTCERFTIKLDASI